MSDDKYILDDDGNVQPEPDLLKWAKWIETHRVEKRVAEDYIGDARVSTVFLALDYRFVVAGKPILWETMIFGGGEELDQYQERYTSREAALAGHAEAVELVRKRWEEIEQLKGLES